ncbi:MAG: hypothetical protein AVDCRST_MAG77-4109 [uncultured Chloroflexi bacterium]|uniref:Uncharacterized protein n=1 Tax=uncultured Chloroflexota bacterium TaxID=166587 RepID=A0A6J4JQ95_9CHLR|nr:MAG: hypothetical protein AVDCRST_MAG77-4109 [uncultured Chloroflexota bacterium]
MGEARAVRHAVADELAGAVGMLELVLVGHYGPPDAGAAGCADRGARLRPPGQRHAAAAAGAGGCRRAWPVTCADRAPAGVRGQARCTWRHGSSAHWPPDARAVAAELKALVGGQQAVVQRRGALRRQAQRIATPDRCD